MHRIIITENLEKTKMGKPHKNIIVTPSHHSYAPLTATVTYLFN